MKLNNNFAPYRIIHFDDGICIPAKYIDIVADMKYAYYNTKADCQLRLLYEFYSEAMCRLKKLGYLTDSQFGSLDNLNYKLYRERLQY